MARANREVIVLSCIHASRTQCPTAPGAAFTELHGNEYFTKSGKLQASRDAADACYLIPPAHYLLPTTYYLLPTPYEVTADYLPTACLPACMPAYLPTYLPIPTCLTTYLPTDRPDCTAQAPAS